MKHIEVDWHYIRDVFLDGTIVPQHVSTNDQLVDIFTKALEKAKFLFFLRKLGIHILHASN